MIAEADEVKYCSYHAGVVDGRHKGGCPFVIDGQGNVCGKQRRTIANADGVKYCKHHTDIVDGKELCPYIVDRSAGTTCNAICRRTSPRDGVAYCSTHAAFLDL